MKFNILSAALVFSASVSFAGQNNETVRECGLAKNPDAGVKVKIVDVGASENSGLLVAVVLSSGNIRPHVIGSYPVTVNPPNGAGIVGYSGKNFSLTISSWTKEVSLKTTGDSAVSISGNGPFFNCD